MTTHTKRHRNGYTLIEMLITVVILGVLTAIALPSYRSYVERTHRTVAKAALSDLVSQQESYSTDHKRYAGNFERLGIGGDGEAATAYVNLQGNLSRNASGALYRLRMHGSGEISDCSALSGGPGEFNYLLSAEPVQARTDSRCATLCLSSNGERGASGEATDCWR